MEIKILKNKVFTKAVDAVAWFSLKGAVIYGVWNYVLINQGLIEIGVLEALALGVFFSLMNNTFKFTKQMWVKCDMCHDGFMIPNISNLTRDTPRWATHIELIYKCCKCGFEYKKKQIIIDK